MHGFGTILAAPASLMNSELGRVSAGRDVDSDQRHNHATPGHRVCCASRGMQSERSQLDLV